jgi:hypothetical protein
MGVIINLPGEVKHYASINRNNIFIQKIEEHTQDEDFNVTTTWAYRINGGIYVWDDEKEYNLRNTGTIIANTQVQVITEETPKDVYSLIYDKYKTTLYDYEDDI